MDKLDSSFRDAWSRPLSDRRTRMVLFLGIATLLFAVLYIYQVVAWPGIQISHKIGWLITIRGGHPTVAAVFQHDMYEEAPPAIRSGLRPGDAILADFTLHSPPRELRGYWDHLEAMKSLRRGESWGVVVERKMENGDFKILTIRIPPLPPLHPSQRLYFAMVNWILPLIGVLTAFFIGFARPRNPNAFRACLLFLAMGLTFVPNEYPYPLLINMLYLVFHRIIESLLPFFIVQFFFHFPTPSLLQRKVPWLKSVFLAYCLAWALVRMITSCLQGFDYLAYTLWSELWRPILAYNKYIWMGMILTGIVSLALNTIQATSKKDRRRLIILLVGSFIGLIPSSAAFLFMQVTGVWTLLLRVCAVILFAIFPLSFIYVVLVHHVFGIRVMLRNSLQYALLSRGFLAVEGIFLFLVLYLVAGPVLTHYLPGAGPGAMAVTAALVTGAAMLVIRWLNRRVMPVIDRRFFREVYDTRRILTDLGSAVRSMAREPDRLVRRVAWEVMDALHPRNVEIFLSGAEKDKLRRVAGAGMEPLRECGPVPKGSYSCCYRLLRTPDTTGDTVEEGPVEGLMTPSNSWFVSKLIRSASEEPRTVDVSRSRLYAATKGIQTSVEASRAEEERSLLKALDTRLLVPLAVENRLIGFLSLGEKLSEEPYSREDRGLLLAVAQQTAMALDYAGLIGEVADQSRIQRDMEIATEVQNRLFPQEFPRMRTLDYAGVCKPAQGVGGDYYDFIPVGFGKLGVALGDVSGKGVSAALIMANLQATLRSQAAFRGVRVEGLLEEINRLLGVSTDRSKFATLFYGVYDDEARSLTYVNAGHIPPFLFREGRALGRSEGLRSTGGILGIFDDSQFEKEVVRLHPGDILVIYSDGATDAFDPSGDSFEEERLRGSILQNAHLPAVEILNRAMAEIIRFQGAALQFDDITLVVAKVL